jgi:hypothetical protein
MAISPRSSPLYAFATAVASLNDPTILPLPFRHSSIPGYNCKGGIVLNIHNNNIRKGVDVSTGAGGMFGSRRVYPISVNHACMLTNIVVCPVRFFHTWEGEAQLILKIIEEVHGADLRRFDKHKKECNLMDSKDICGSPRS